MPGKGRTTLAAAAAAMLFVATARAETVTVAVASNFAPTARELVEIFEADGEHSVQLVTGSSGRLFAQIVNGAPFDVFLSADRERPLRLEARSMTVHGGRFPYAVGRLVIWSADGRLGDNCLAILANPGDTKVAIANPELAPYGAAARHYLQDKGFWEPLQSNLVYGENVSQVAQFVSTRNAGVGLLSASQLRLMPAAATACSHEIPQREYPIIEQHLAFLASAESNPAARAFVEFLKGEAAEVLIVEHGYERPRR